MKRWCHVILTLTFFVLMSLDEAQGQEANQMTKWPWPIALPANSGDDVQALADDLKGQLGIKINTIRAEKNPVCCLWIEVGAWIPNPSQPGYMVIIQPGGGLVMATDIQQLKLAAAHIVRACDKRNPEIELPVGMLTNYPVLK